MLDNHTKQTQDCYYEAIYKSKYRAKLENIFKSPTEGFEYFFSTFEILGVLVAPKRHL